MTEDRAQADAPASIDALLHWLRRRLPGHAGVASRAIVEASASGADDARSGEAHVIATAGPRRRREFLAGRAAARASLAAWGQAPAPILARDEGDPLWPPGVVGSISHTERWALAVTASSAALGAIGLDLEPGDPLSPDLVALVCRPDEIGRGWEPGLDGIDPAKLRFVAKEAFYKAAFPRARRFVEFHEVRIDFDPVSGGGFTASFLGPDAPSGGRMPRRAPGAFVQADGHLCALCAWPPATFGD